jgi:hypothetical protein
MVEDGCDVVNQLQHQLQQLKTLDIAALQQLSKQELRVVQGELQSIAPEILNKSTSLARAPRIILLTTLNGFWMRLTRKNYRTLTCLTWTAASIHSSQQH